jgi:hypothetical protein
MSQPQACLISCVKQKSNKPEPAIDLYKSSLFIKSRGYAEKLGLPIYILSAKYYLIHSSQLVQPYNLTLNDFSKNELDKWAFHVGGQIFEQFNQDAALLVLAGSRYLSFRKYVDNPIIDPMIGLSIGKRLQYLTRQIESH